jgi:hypothetical protein
VVEGTDQTHPELLELAVDAVLQVTQGDVQLDVVQLVEAHYLHRV